MYKHVKKHAKLRDLFKLQSNRWDYPPETKKKKVTYDDPCGDEPALYSHNQTPIYKSCWEQRDGEFHQTIITGPCWDYPPSKFKRPAKVKICRGDERLYKAMDPDFKGFQTLYTKWDYALEQCVHDQVMQVESELQKISVTVLEEINKQIASVDEMRYHATRYRLLVSGGCCIKPYPEFVSAPTERRALCAFQMAFDVVNESNCKLVDLITTIKASMDELKARANKLDHTLKSPFLNGNGYGQPPLATVLEMVQDVYQYFYTIVVKLKSWSDLMDAGNEYSVEDYLVLLNSIQNYKQLLRIGVSHCTCKRRFTRENALEPFKPWWAHKREYYEDKASPLPKYRCDVELMTQPEQHSTQCEEEVESRSIPSTSVMVKSDYDDVVMVP